VRGCCDAHSLWRHEARGCQYSRFCGKCRLERHGQQWQRAARGRVDGDSPAPTCCWRRDSGGSPRKSHRASCSADDLTLSELYARPLPRPRPIPQHSTRRHSRNHGCPLRGSAALCHHDWRTPPAPIARPGPALTPTAVLRFQRRVRRQAQGDAERRKEDQARN
jgi:hypothetical protein